MQCSGALYTSHCNYLTFHLVLPTVWLDVLRVVSDQGNMVIVEDNYVGIRI